MRKIAIILLGSIFLTSFAYADGNYKLVSGEVAGKKTMFRINTLSGDSWMLVYRKKPKGCNDDVYTWVEIAQRYDIEDGDGEVTSCDLTRFELDKVLNMARNMIKKEEEHAAKEKQKQAD